eukprot:TRINITY_DN579_c0_g1_i2.p1 TRINITY_DN579_c0_g1~~TRINITY_DN579_c0_g1_i2.p1  ORF type:complete len:404 (-),score=182.62 TRINITY_DN579_c0_g1_i2:107-1318(-)
MPAKKKKMRETKKRMQAEEKKTKKVMEDKTFGLKNKNKSKKVQKYISQIQKQTTGEDDVRRNRTNAHNKEEQARKKAAKNAKKQKALMADMMMKSKIRQPKLAPGTDPKTVLCAFFKAGQCKKSEEECIYSHDLDIEKKQAAKNLFVDARRKDDDDEKDDSTSADWTQEQLEEIVKKKQSSANKNLPTEKVCKFFLQAVERGQFGWFWKCQNGDSCIYKHALPEGYVFKKDKIKPKEEKELSLEQLVEIERGKLETFTPVTEESFKEWKEARMARRAKEKEEKLAEMKAAKSGGGGKSKSASKDENAGLTGRALFEMDESLFVDDEGASDEKYKSKEDEEDDDEDEVSNGKGIEGDEEEEGEGDDDGDKGEIQISSVLDDEALDDALEGLEDLDLDDLDGLDQ